MEESPAVGAGLERFYERFSAADPDEFAEGIARCPGVSVIGSGPGEGNDEREAWVEAYRTQIRTLGITLRGGDRLRAYEEGDVGWAVDEPAFVLPDGSTLATRLTGVLHREDGEWKVVHLHFSVGVPDEEAIQPPAEGSAPP